MTLQSKVSRNDIIVWECLEDERIVKIAKDLGYEGKSDRSEYEKLWKERDELLKKHGLNPRNCAFDEADLGTEDYQKYLCLCYDMNRVIQDIRDEEVDKCIDWLMDNGYAIKVVKV